MKQEYIEAFIEQAVVKLLSRGKRTVREVALDLNVSYPATSLCTRSPALLALYFCIKRAR